MRSALEMDRAVAGRFCTGAMSRKNLDSVDETRAPNQAHHDPSNPAELRGGPKDNRA